MPKRSVSDMIKKISPKIFILLLLTCQILLGQNALSSDFPEKPNPPRLVTDFTMTLNQEETNALEQKLKAYSDSTSSQIAIVVIKNIGDYEISQYATELALKWGIGVKGKNNGLLILWATGNRKIYIATGYGFEEKVPDAIAKRIVNQLILPNFKLGQYYQGLNLATDEIIARMSGQFVKDQTTGEEEFPLGFFLMLLLFMFILFYLINKNRGGGRGNRFNDRNRGGFGGGMPWIISNSGGSSGWGGGGDSGWGGGGGGGGFGGFGGGDFGGGGAGGDY
jgi:uncharacterized protein